VHNDVVVVIGAGGMGQAIARRVGSGRSVLLADSDEHGLDVATAALESEGHRATSRRVDVSSPESVRELVHAAIGLGHVVQVVHTAGVSPAQATSTDILRVDAVGVALVLEELGQVITEGGSGVVIASMAGHLAAPLTVEQEQQLRGTPAAELLQLPMIGPYREDHPGAAYAFAKRANQLRVQAASVAWGERGARVNSISPGVISTSMGRHELSSEAGDTMRQMIGVSAAKRLGTPDDIAGVAAFLLGPDATFITGTDILVDGGVVASLRSGPSGPST
jgi:NAD(P)-dependent dehydrogenase (short-subunit alcohol dehydrogenase family)